MAKDTMISVEIDLDVSNDVPASIRYSDLTDEELDEAIEREAKVCESLESWGDALKASGLKL